MSLPEITRGAILAACGAGAFQRGERYAEERRVVHLQMDPDDGLILSAVEGSNSEPYEQEINIIPGQRQARISGYCDCPVGYNCKHVVAALLTLMQQLEAGLAPSGNSLALANWQRRLRAAERPPTPDTTHREQRVIYLFGENDDGALEIGMQRVRRRKDGTWGKPLSIPGAPWNYTSSDHLAPADATIVELLGDSGNVDWEFTPEGRLGAMALVEILDSGRGILPANGEQVVPGDRRTLDFSWDGNNGREQLQVALADCDGDWLLATTEPPHYIDMTSGHCGPIDTPLSSEQILLLRQMPPVPEESQLETAQLLAEQLPEDTLPLPVDNLVDIGGEPTPLLRLAYREALDCHYAALHFVYDGYEIRAFPPAATQLLETDGGQLLVTRDGDFELGAIDRLEELGFTGYRLSPTDVGDVGFLLPDTETLPSPLRWAEFLDRDAEQLHERGWRIEKAADFKLDVTTADSLSGELHSNSLGIQVNFGDEQLELLPLLTRALEYGGELPEGGLMVELGRDQWLNIPRDWVEPVLDTLIELHEEPALDKKGHLKMHRHNLAPLAQLEDELGDSDFAWSGGEERRALARELKNLQGLETVTPPEGLQAELRDYQREGLNWLAFLHRFQFGGILADDMGLGKTLQTLAFILHLKERGELRRAALIVAPTSLLGNWLHEAQKFTPGLSAVISHGTDRKPKLRRLKDYDLVITSYALAQRDADILARHPFSLLVLDEAQAIKNPRAKVSQALRGYKTTQRLCLTGTPLENHLGEFWAQFDFLMPGLLGNDKSFNRLYRKPIEKEADESRRNQLRSRTAPFMLRRTKEQVAGELPPKTEIVQAVTLGDKQQKLYQTVRASMEKEVRKLLDSKGLAKSHIQVLDALLKLRQICCDPSLVKIPSAAKVKQSAKLEALLEMLEEMLAEGRRILLFSQFTSMLSIVERELKKRGVAHSKLTGRTRKRDKAIDAFQSGEVPLFLISLKAGGFGLNLTAADTVIHYDPWWNPAAENQATDRAHRIGQQKSVFVYKLIAEGTIEERIQEMQRHKQSLADALLAGEGAALSSLSGEEILELFS
ncbi:DEAD/DEAH box helicase [Microbulbifer halophilus]|uniref:SNF2-related protein n=1 Tax=Microbulbifer halophilus TaxID=453963 RepID=A0ABW5E7N5_9GAMM|nr:DEAD/DEAH box helicase [Microbulbifer halophilus]MCW8125277.1 DEAD/DEAH box helicase [Microbulbifer halophilus]